MDSAQALVAVSHAEHNTLAQKAKAEFDPGDVRIHAKIWDGGAVPHGRKLVHWVRHGQGYHNLLSEVTRKLGFSFSEAGDYERAKKDVFNPYLLEAIQDPPLTVLGRRDARNLQLLAKTLNPQLLVVSPLKRATQTILIAFREHLSREKPPALVAHEGCREHIGVHVCDQRSPRSEYVDEFPHIDVTNIQHEDDPMSLTQRETYLEMSHRSHAFMLWMRDQAANEIVVGTHSAFLMASFNIAMELDAQDEMKSFFKTGELRSVVLEFIEKSDEPAEKRQRTA